MQNITLDVKNNAQNILPVPYLKSPVPSVESPVDFGASPFPAALKQTSRKDDNLQYCNFLEPSPRDQKLNVPYEGNKNCPTFTAQPYNKDSCYLLDSKAQGVAGIVCNQAGGSDNADFYRGNQFGVDYPFDFNQQMSNKKIEYTVENPVQLPMELQNPMIMYDKTNNDFYPTPSFQLMKNKDFLTYPLQQKFTIDGYPTYAFPYKTLNPSFNPSMSHNESIEPFENLTSTKTQFFFILLIIAFFIFFIFLIRK